MTLLWTRRLAGLLAAAGIGLAGCGGDDQAAEPPGQAATPTPTMVAATPTPTPTTTPTPTATKKVTKPKPRAPKATPTAVTKPEPPPQKPSVQITCLRAAGLTSASKRGATLWSATDPKSRSLVTVDGPYRSNGEAQGSADSLGAIADTEVGGRLVVSAPLRAQATPTLRKIARCLETR